MNLGRINILDKAVAEKIAAGEVIERPASVVKELVENSIDAGAHHIQINLEEGGQKLIEVIDDGVGMNEHDLKLAVQRFATSKIKALEDLENIHTFGFRGEALPSIGAISKMEIITKEKSSPTGARIICNGGVIDEPTPTGAPDGTRVIVRDIFFNTPARRKFMKSASGEAAHIVAITQKMALINEEISFHLSNNGRTLLDFPAKMTCKERILKIWGLPLNFQPIFVEHETSTIRISGYICPPDKNKTNRMYQFFFVNRRYVKNPMISQAVQDGFSPLIPTGKYPIVLIFIDMQGSDLDINVHPNKMEVRFVKPSEVFSAVRDAIKKALRKYGYSPIAPSILPQNGEIPVRPKGKPLITSGYSNKNIEATSSFAGHTPSSYLSKEQLSFTMQSSWNTALSGQQTISGILDVEKSGESSRETDGVGFVALTQIQKTYIIGKVRDELWIVDQHTAHERINYEKLAHIGKEQYRSQKLLFPIVMELPPTLFNFLQDKKEQFESLGFEIEPFGGNSYLIKAVPYGFKNLDNQGNLTAILEEVAGEEPYRNITAFYERLRSSIACKASVKAGDTLTLEEMTALVNELIMMDYSAYCPHGRPIVIKLSKEHMDRMFHRI